MLGGAGSVTTGAAFSFASTYALGHVAKRYYAGGRRIDAAGLQQAFTEMLGQAKQLQGKYTGQIAEQARTLDLNKLLAAVRPCHLVAPGLRSPSRVGWHPPVAGSAGAAYHRARISLLEPVT